MNLKTCQRRKKADLRDITQKHRFSVNWQTASFRKLDGVNDTLN